MKFRGFGAAAFVGAVIVFVSTGYAAAATIDILQVNNHIAGGSPAAPAWFTLLDLGTGSPNAQQTTSTFTVGGVTFSFSGGSAEWAGNTANSSPFGFDNTSKNFVAAANGNVDVTWATTQNALYVLWGTVDPEPGRNVITIGATQIDGAAILAAIIDQGFTLYDHQSNTYLRITGLPDFTSATFFSNDPSFEFALGTTPLPATLPLFVTGLGALGLLGWRRKRKQATRLGVTVALAVIAIAPPARADFIVGPNFVTEDHVFSVNGNTTNLHIYSEADDTRGLTGVSWELTSSYFVPLNTLNIHATVSVPGVADIFSSTTPGPFNGVPISLNGGPIFLSPSFFDLYKTGLVSAPLSFSDSLGVFESQDIGVWSGHLRLTYTYSETPLPAALPLFVTSLGALGLFGWRRKKRNALAGA